MDCLKDYLFFFKVKNDEVVIKSITVDINALGGQNLWQIKGEYNDMHLLFLFPEGADQDTILEKLQDKGHKFWLDVFI